MAVVRKFRRFRLAAGARRCLNAVTLAFCAPSLTGCPLGDDYYIDDSLADGGSGGSTSQNSGDGGGGGTSDSVGGSSGADSGTSTHGETATVGGSSTDGAGGSSTTGAGGSSAGGANSTSGAGGSSTTGAGGSENQVTTTTGGQTCSVSCNAGRSCTDDTCESGWVAMAEPPSSFVARRRAAAVGFDGKVFIFGGVDEDGYHLDSGAIYDPKSDTWSLVANDSATPSPRELASAVWTGSQILVVGGSAEDGDYYLNDAALYDPVDDSWATIDSAPTPRAKGIAGVVDGVVVLMQGETTYGDAEVDAERYDLDSGTWSVAGDPGDLPGLWSSAIAFGDTDVFMFGGNSNSGRTNAAYRYDVAEDEWLTLPDTLTARSG